MMRLSEIEKTTIVNAILENDKNAQFFFYLVHEQMILRKVEILIFWYNQMKLDYWKL